jgi:hypothetical protein
MFGELTVVEQIMAELNGAASEEAKFVATAKIVYTLIKANRVYRPLKVKAFNANGILKQRYELSNTAARLTYRRDSLFRDTSKTT